MIQKWEFKETAIKGLWEIDPFVATDNRGRFVKDFSLEMFQQNGINHNLKEVFYTYSFKGVIRAMHFQKKKQQTKLVRCVNGKIYDVVCDLRNNSNTFKKWLAFELSADNHKEILIPEGCAHGYLVLEDSIVSYKCGEKFYGEYDSGIAWDDPEIGIEWPLELVGGIENIILAEKDKTLPSFKEFLESYSDFM